MAPFSHEQCVLNAVHHLEQFDEEVMPLLVEELGNIVEREKRVRRKLRSVVQIANEKPMPQKHFARKSASLAVKENRVCKYCNRDCFLSAIQCPKCCVKDEVLCLACALDVHQGVKHKTTHIQQPCTRGAEVTLMSNFSTEKLDSLVEEARADLREMLGSSEVQ